jgi:hypothetical protein
MASSLIHEALMRLFDDRADGFGAQIFDPLPGPGDVRHLALFCAIRFAGQRQQQIADFLKPQLLQPEGVFHVDDPIADVVGGLDQISQRMPAPGAGQGTGSSPSCRRLPRTDPVVLIEAEFLEGDAGRWFGGSHAARGYLVKAPSVAQVSCIPPGLSGLCSG